MSDGAEIEVEVEVEPVTTSADTASRITKYLTKDQLRNIFYAIIILIIGGIVVGIVAAVVYELYRLGYVVAFLYWIQNLGWKGNIVMIICIIIVNFPFVMGYGSLMLASGYIFKFELGLLTVVVGCQIGVLLVSLLIRIKYFRERSERYINSKLYVKAMMEELILHKLKFAFLIRMSPIPLGMQNLVLSLSGVPLWQYQITSLLGLLVEQAPVVYIGSTLGNITDVMTGVSVFDTRELLVIGISATAIVILLIFLFIVTKNAFKKVKQREAELKKKQEEEHAEVIEIQLETIHPKPPADPLDDSPLHHHNDDDEEITIICDDGDNDNLVQIEVDDIKRTADESSTTQIHNNDYNNNDDDFDSDHQTLVNNDYSTGDDHQQDYEMRYDMNKDEHDFNANSEFSNFAPNNNFENNNYEFDDSEFMNYHNVGEFNAIEQSSPASTFEQFGQTHFNFDQNGDYQFAHQDHHTAFSNNNEITAEDEFVDINDVNQNEEIEKRDNRDNEDGKEMQHAPTSFIFDNQTTSNVTINFNFNDIHSDEEDGQHDFRKLEESVEDNSEML